jgi:hypothetical protein
MAIRARLFLLSILFLFATGIMRADARFDLVGPRIDVQVTRSGVTLPIASVPNLQPGDRLWLHPSLPGSQSVHYLLVCVFLRGNTNPPPPDWFIRIETWNKKVQEEGAFVTVPAEAQQAVLLMAPETGGDFTTLRSAVMGRPGVFVRASQDLILAGFEQARIEKYLASIRRVPATEADKLEKHSDLLARTLALKPNDACFKQPVDTQFTCLTQTGTQTLLDDGHGESMIATLSSGVNSDFINAASYTGLAGGGVYSAYVGAIVDLVRIMGNLHTAKYQYIPAIGFPQGQSLNLRLNMPPSFQNPKSVLVIGLPAVQKAVAPPLRPADAAHVACLLQPQVVLPIEGAPLVFSTSFAHDLVLHLKTPPGAPAEADIPLVPDAFQGGLVLEHGVERREILRDPLPPAGSDAEVDAVAKPDAAKPQPKPVMIEGTIEGRWGFDPFVGPTVPLQQLPGTGWHIVTASDAAATRDLIAGQSGDVFLASTGNACVHTITAHSAELPAEVQLTFKPSEKAGAKNDLEVTLPPQHEVKPGDLQLNIQQFGEPKPDEVTTRTFAEPAHIAAVEIHAGDRSLVLSGTSLAQVENLTIGDLVFTPQGGESNSGAENAGTLRLILAKDASVPPTHVDDKLNAKVTLRDGRSLKVPVVVASARPAITLLSKTAAPAADQAIALTNPDDLPLSQKLTFTLKTVAPFPRNGQIEIETVDGTLRTVLTLAPSGGLVLQDPHTVVATLDPLRSFGPSAFGPIHLRAVYAEASAGAAPTSDWLPLATLVRLPVLTQINCPGDATQPCTLSGSSLYLIQSISTDPEFANPVAVPDGYVGSTLSVPGPLPATVYLRLRDDPAAIDPAVIPATQASANGTTATARASKR